MNDGNVHAQYLPFSMRVRFWIPISLIHRSKMAFFLVVREERRSISTCIFLIFLCRNHDKGFSPCSPYAFIALFLNFLSCLLCQSLT